MRRRPSRPRVPAGWAVAPSVGRVRLILLAVLALLGGIAPAAHAGSGPTAQVVGGRPATIDEYPFMAHLEIEIGPNTYACGGSLIDDRHVLTAAHCVTDFGGNAVAPAAVTVTLGVDRLSSASSNNEFATTAVAPHPNYNPDTQAFDAAVLTLDRTVPGGAKAQPIARIEPGSRLDDKGKQAQVAGWGYRKFNRPATAPDQLHAAGLKVTGYKVCKRAYDRSGLTVSRATMLCAYAQARDTCQGDSGGPILVRTATGPVQIGITSFGIGCAFKGIPGVYTRLSNPDIAAFVDEAVGGG